MKSLFGPKLPFFKHAPLHHHDHHTCWPFIIMNIVTIIIIIIIVVIIIMPAGPSPQIAPWSERCPLSNYCLPHLNMMIMIIITMNIVIIIMILVSGYDDDVSSPPYSKAVAEAQKTSSDRRQ